MIYHGDNDIPHNYFHLMSVNLIGHAYVFLHCHCPRGRFNGQIVHYIYSIMINHGDNDIPYNYFYLMSVNLIGHLYVFLHYHCPR